MENIPQSLVSHLVSSPLYVTEHVSELQGIVSHGSTYNPQLAFVFQKLRSSSEFFSTHLCPQADSSIALIPFSPWTETPWAPLESCLNFPISTSGHLGSSWVHKQSRNTFALLCFKVAFQCVSCRLAEQWLRRSTPAHLGQQMPWWKKTSAPTCNPSRFSQQFTPGLGNLFSPSFKIRFRELPSYSRDKDNIVTCSESLQIWQLAQIHADSLLLKRDFLGVCPLPPASSVPGLISTSTSQSSPRYLYFKNCRQAQECQG